MAMNKHNGQLRVTSAIIQGGRIALAPGGWELAGIGRNWQLRHWSRDK